MRRRWDGWVDRGSFVWAGIQLRIALRDAERALFSHFGPNVKPDWDAALRPLYLIGLGYMVIMGGALLLKALGA